MKTLLKIIIASSLTMSLQAQTKFEEGMSKAIDLWTQNQPEAASNLFERIAKVEKENWLPYYYVALVNVTSSFELKDKSQVPLKLQKAQENLNISRTYTSKENVEIMVVQALLHLSDMLQDVPSKSQTLAPKIEGLYQKAVAMDAKNPRAVSGLADWKYSSAMYFKQDVTPYCNALKKALVLFDNYEQTIPFGPTWGRQRAQQLVDQCKDSKGI